MPLSKKLFIFRKFISETNNHSLTLTYSHLGHIFSSLIFNSCLAYQNRLCQIPLPTVLYSQKLDGHGKIWEGKNLLVPHSNYWVFWPASEPGLAWKQKNNVVQLLCPRNVLSPTHAVRVRDSHLIKSDRGNNCFQKCFGLPFDHVNVYS